MLKFKITFGFKDKPKQMLIKLFEDIAVASDWANGESVKIGASNSLVERL